MSSGPPDLADRPAAAPSDANGLPDFHLIELLFFAYRDFVGDADRLLEVYGFGRAHHRVLHFVHRLPGMTVAELLVILRITKQSLNRVMKDLLDAGFIEVKSGSSDRRQRRLFVSEEGSRLALDLATMQSARFGHALSGMGDGARQEIAAFLFRMIDPAERGHVTALLSRRKGTGVGNQGCSE